MVEKGWWGSHGNNINHNPDIENYRLVLAPSYHELKFIVAIHKVADVVVLIEKCILGVVCVGALGVRGEESLEFAAQIAIKAFE